MRSLDAWDGVGALATTAVASVVATWGAVRGTPGYNWLPEMVFVLALSSSTVALAASVALAKRESLDVKLVPGRLTQIWRDPPRDWVMFFAGFLVALPALALHTDVIGDADSARVIASTMYVERNGPGYLVDTQDNLLAHLTIGPLLALGGIPAAVLFSTVTLQALAGSVSYLAWKLTRSTVAAFGAVLALLAFPIMWQRANLLPLYALMLACGFLGLFFAHQATALKGNERTRAAVLAGAAFVLSIEAHRLGQFFLVFSLFLFLTGPWRQVVQGLARVYAIVLVLSIPRIVINLREGGLDYFLSNRVDYWITEGYLVRVQNEFFHVPASEDLGGYLHRLIKNLDPLFSWPGLLVLALGVAGLLLVRGQAKWFALTCVMAFVAAILYKQVPFYERYFSPLMVASTLGFALFIGALRRRAWPLKAVAVIVLVGILVGAGNAYTDAVQLAQRRERSTLRGPLPEIAAKIDDGKGVIGARVNQLLYVDAEIKTFGGQFLSEAEYVTYLTWPSDREVIEMMRAHDIGWVLITPRPRREVDYHDIWLQWAHGKSARHVESVAASPGFCRELDLEGYVLYKVGSCPA